MPLKRDGWDFLHVGVIVRDAVATMEFYLSLGFDIVDAPFHTPSRSPDNPRTSRIARVRKGGAVLEIIQPLQGRWINKEFLETVGEGVNHIAFAVDDLAAERAQMVGMGFAIVLETQKAIYFDTRATGNVIIELVRR